MVAGRDFDEFNAFTGFDSVCAVFSTTRSVGGATSTYLDMLAAVVAMGRIAFFVRGGDGVDEPTQSHEHGERDEIDLHDGPYSLFYLLCLVSVNR
ncbi:hypothetical protein DL763_008926 [Monosporascus cannonballus]|nr:hypothetical protein DL763_008926 [Monosporascus cannonballus]